MNLGRVGRLPVGEPTGQLVGDVVPHCTIRSERQAERAIHHEARGSPGDRSAAFAAHQLVLDAQALQSSAVLTQQTPNAPDQLRSVFQKEIERSRKLAREPLAALELGVAGQIETLSGQELVLVHQLQISYELHELHVLDVDDRFPHGALKHLGQRVHGDDGIGHVLRTELLDVDGRTETHQDAAPKALTALEIQPDRNDFDPEAPIEALLALEGDARGPGLQLLHARLLGADALREDADHALLAHDLEAGREHLDVAIRRLGRILAPVHRDHAELAQEPGAHVRAKQAAVRQIADHAPTRGAQDQRVRDRLRVVGGENDRAGGRQVLQARDLTLPEVDGQRKLRDRSGQPIEKGFFHSSPTGHDQV